MLVFYNKGLLALQLACCRTTPCWISVTDYSAHLQLPFISGGLLLHPQHEDANAMETGDPLNMAKITYVMKIMFTEIHK